MIYPGGHARRRSGGAASTSSAARCSRSPTGRASLPVAHNAGLVWPRNAFLKYPGKVTVVIGAPIDTRGRTPTDVMREVEAWIEGEMARLIPPETLASRGAGAKTASNEALVSSNETGAP